MRTNPFTVLGLPTDPDLTDEQVRAAWRATAAATHPDRPDGGDVQRYTADLTAGLPGTVAPASGPLLIRGELRAGLLEMAALLPARIRRGRPRHLALRAVVTALLSLTVVNPVPGQPSGPAVVTGLITWFLLTARGIWPRRRAG